MPSKMTLSEGLIISASCKIFSVILSAIWLSVTENEATVSMTMFFLWARLMPLNNESRERNKEGGHFSFLRGGAWADRALLLSSLVPGSSVQGEIESTAWTDEANLDNDVSNEATEEDSLGVDCWCRYRQSLACRQSPRWKARHIPLLLSFSPLWLFPLPELCWRGLSLPLSKFKLFLPCSLSEESPTEHPLRQSVAQQKTYTNQFHSAEGIQNTSTCTCRCRCTKMKQ